MKDLFKVDFFKEFPLPTPIAGLVEKITSPRGIKRQESYGYSYHLHTDLSCLYRDEPCTLEAGIYWVMCIYREEGATLWNHYIFVIEDDGTMYSVAEFIDCRDTTWVKQALPIIKRAFNGDTEVSDITVCGDSNSYKDFKRSKK